MEPYIQLSDTSIIMDASEYIKELKQKVVRLNQEIACAQNALRQNSYPTVPTASITLYLHICIYINTRKRDALFRSVLARAVPPVHMLPN